MEGFFHMSLKYAIRDNRSICVTVSDKKTVSYDFESMYTESDYVLTNDVCDYRVIDLVGVLADGTKKTIEVIITNDSVDSYKLRTKEFKKDGIVVYFSKNALQRICNLDADGIRKFMKNDNGKHVFTANYYLKNRRNL